MYTQSIFRKRFFGRTSRIHIKKAKKREKKHVNQLPLYLPTTRSAPIFSRSELFSSKKCESSWMKQRVGEATITLASCLAFSTRELNIGAYRCTRFINFPWIITVIGSLSSWTTKSYYTSNTPFCFSFLLFSIFQRKCRRKRRRVDNEREYPMAGFCHAVRWRSW